MKKFDFSWVTIDREDLPALLVGSANNVRTRRDRGKFLDHTTVAVGYVDESYKNIYNVPSIVVISDEYFAEIFAWLITYAPDVSPISQFTRIITVSEMESLEAYEKNLYGLKSAYRTDILACLVIGEVLSQVESASDLHLVPMSSASACFLMSIARSMAIYGEGHLLDQCIKRLTQLDGDERFAKRSIKVDDVKPIFDVFISCSDDLYKLQTHEVAYKIAETASEVLSVYISDSSPLFSLDLRSDSVESRVIGFRNLVDYLLREEVYKDNASSHSLQLALGVFLVGRGTSHLFLLKELDKKFPTVYLWFALVAAQCGPLSWKGDWLKAVKSIEKYLRSSFSLKDPVGADVCWSEYHWAANVMKAKRLFSDVPKSSSKALSIEIIPGVTCQFRVASHADSNQDMHSKYTNDIFNMDLKNILIDMIETSKKASVLMEKLGFNNDVNTISNYKEKSSKKSNSGKTKRLFPD